MDFFGRIYIGRRFPPFRPRSDCQTPSEKSHLQRGQESQRNSKGEESQRSIKGEEFCSICLVLDVSKFREFSNKKCPKFILTICARV